MTPTLSVDASQRRPIAVCVVDVQTIPDGVLGRVVSGRDTVNERVAGDASWLPAASLARTLNT